MGSCFCRIPFSGLAQFVVLTFVQSRMFAHTYTLDQHVGSYLGTYILFYVKKSEESRNRFGRI